jgi:hypothetical protein
MPTSRLLKRFNLFQSFHAPAIQKEIRWLTILYHDDINNNTIAFDHWKKIMDKNYYMNGVPLNKVKILVQHITHE